MKLVGGFCCLSNGDSVSPHSVRVEPDKPHSEMPKANRLQLPMRPAWKTLFNPVLPDVCPGVGAKAQLPFPVVLAMGLAFLLPQITGTQISRNRLEWGLLELREP